MAATREMQHRYNAPATLPQKVSGAFAMQAIELTGYWTTARLLLSSPDKQAYERNTRLGLDLQQKMSNQFPQPWMSWLFNTMGGYFIPGGTDGREVESTKGGTSNMEDHTGVSK